MSQFGLSDEVWASAVEEVRAAILDAAREQKMISYGEIADKVSAASVGPYSSLMNHLLGAVFEEEREAGRPALTSIVTHKYGDKEPGSGFYDMARALGYQFSEPYLFWAEQVELVFTTYGRPA